MSLYKEKDFSLGAEKDGRSSGFSRDVPMSASQNQQPNPSIDWNSFSYDYEEGEKVYGFVLVNGVSTAVILNFPISDSSKGEFVATYELVGCDASSCNGKLSLHSTSILRLLVQAKHVSHLEDSSFDEALFVDPKILTIKRNSGGQCHIVKAADNLLQTTYTFYVNKKTGFLKYQCSCNESDGDSFISHPPKELLIDRLLSALERCTKNAKSIDAKNVALNVYIAISIGYTYDK